MLQLLKNLRNQELGVFLFAFLVPLIFAIYTNHAWEDWYITYRASKNLAIGNGLVFTVGERVHSFTSPLGTLIPSLFNILSGNTSDDLVLWLYRVFNCVLLGLTGVVLLRITRYLKLNIWAVLTLLGMFIFDLKTVDFSINGMETAIMVFFLSLKIHLLLIPSKRPALYLGLVWAGLMWTRPDSFIYIVGLSLGFLLFPRSFSEPITRLEIIKRYGRAVLIVALVYGPWLLWAWSYYGSFIPHTVIAKGLSKNRSLTALVGSVLQFPLKSLISRSRFDALFLPAYATDIGGWPLLPEKISRGIGWVSSFGWLFPFVTPQTRGISFAALFANLYLNFGMKFAFPWYFPPVTLLNIIAFALLLDRAIQSVQQPDARPATPLAKEVRRYRPIIFGTIGVFAVSMSIWFLFNGAYQLRIQQTVIEEGNRKAIGLWLREKASSPNDRVFLECLGYIGFYSNLKMYDYPGLSSPEVVAARRKLRSNKYGDIINYLRPEWAVLRPREIQGIERLNPKLLDGVYKPVKVFDVSDQVKSHRSLYGRNYLKFDQTFTVFRLQDQGKQ